MTCPRFGKWIGGCKFEPRYDEPQVGPLGMFHTSSITWSEGRPAIVSDPTPIRRYVQDVCTRCGKTVKREERI